LLDLQRLHGQSAKRFLVRGLVTLHIERQDAATELNGLHDSPSQRASRLAQSKDGWADAIEPHVYRTDNRRIVAVLTQ
jgi:hypothetical protein